MRNKNIAKKQKTKKINALMREETFGFSSKLFLHQFVVKGDVYTSFGSCVCVGKEKRNTTFNITYYC